MATKEFIFSIGYPGYRPVHLAKDDVATTMKNNAEIMFDVVCAKLEANPSAILDVNLRWADVDVEHFLTLCRTKGWSIRPLETEPVFHETCLEVQLR